MNVISDELPIGWKKRFEDELLREIEVALCKDGIDPDSVSILQMKEKFGELRVYLDTESTQANRVIEKYNVIAKDTCICCGETTYIRKYHCPVCIKCQARMR